MSRKTNATLIGGFVVAGLAVIAAAIIALAGNSLFTQRERIVMHFSGSVYGLQVGAPVVFRGVRLGSVESIDIFYDHNSNAYSIPVVAELDSNAVRGLDGQRGGAPAALDALIEQGLSAQLAMQSLLTGLLYVDLDLRPRLERSQQGTYRGATEIPTTATAIQNLREQFEGMDFRRIADDISAIASSARAVVSGPQLKQAMDDLAAITAAFKRISERFDQRMAPLGSELQQSLVATRKAMEDLGRAAQSVNAAAAGVGKTSDQMSALLAPDSPLVADLQRAAAEVARTAGSLREATSGDAPLVVGADRALDDLSRAARALRDLAETLEQQPDSLLRGRRRTTE